MRKLIECSLLLITGVLPFITAIGQNNFPVNGAKFENNDFVAFTNCVLHIDPETTVDNGTLIIQKGKVYYAGDKTRLPKNCVEKDMKGQHIYPSFIDLNSSYGLPKEAEKEKKSRSIQYSSSKKGAYYWNEAIHPEYNASAYFEGNEKDAKKYREMGFGVIQSHNQDGIARGTSCVVSLQNKNANKALIKENASAHFSLQKGKSKQSYPSSLMGSIALLRQALYDARWYRRTQDKNEINISLEALNNQENLPLFIEAKEKYDILREDKIGDEFGLQFNFIGDGDEYKIISAIKQTGGNLIIPINFPKPYDVENPYDAMNVTLEQLKHWELAPYNPYFLQQNEVAFSITASSIDKSDLFLKNLRKAVNCGLTEENALKALTTTPASLINMSDHVGSLEQGKWANFIVVSDNLFKKNAIIYDNYIQGYHFEIKPRAVIDIRGEYSLNVNQDIRVLKVKGTYDKPTATIEYRVVVDSVSKSGDLVLNTNTGKPVKTTKKKTTKVNISVEDNQISLAYQIQDKVYRLAGIINFDSGSWDGNAQLSDGEWIKWTAIRRKKHEDKPEKETKKDSVLLSSFNYPMVAYGWDSLPVQKTILIKNATVWTSEEEGVLENTDILIQNGKIKSIGKIADVVGNDVIRIDGTGKHITAGIIDEHSHIAIARGVNEGSNVVTSEVRIGDVINPDDINIYRQLSGGVTTSQLLHGSANPIGGQSAIIKLRWGYLPDSLKFKGADGFIKFALGENVKQSNWGSNYTIRFPQTRMGVEQVYYDAFIKAKNYEAKWEAYNQHLLSKKKREAIEEPRRDLQLEALVEILKKQRFITCHSYIQSEINMLMHVADSMGFIINTFTHILEGYKVADKLKAHGAGASTFSDWWAYKYEVKDAIPYNASLLNQMGLVTAINSDDAEMGRRLNQEAAKAIKYGGMTEEEALKLVTLNPAKLLHIDDRVGSVKIGKDADIVIWSDNPLSIYAKAEQTIIDGIVFYDIKRDLELRKAIEKERNRIIAKMLEAKLKGEETQKAQAPKKAKVHVCSMMSDEG